MPGKGLKIKFIAGEKAGKSLQLILAHIADPQHLQHSISKSRGKCKIIQENAPISEALPDLSISRIRQPIQRVELREGRKAK